MNRFLTIAFLCVALRLFGAPGDTVSFTIRDDGWSATWVVEGMNTNGTWNFGYDTNNTPSASTPTLTVYSPGFTDTGASNWTARTVYLTKQVRYPYSAGGAQNFADQQTDGSYLTNRVALSDFVYVLDGDITLDLPAALYNTNSVSSAAESAFAVVNNSTFTYPKVIGNWSWRGYRVVTEPTMDLRAVAFHAGAKNGKPVARVEFRVKDSGNNWFTNAQTAMQIDRAMPDQNPVPEYIGSFNTNLFTSGLVTCDVRIWPWLGTNILDSAFQTASGMEKVYLVTLTNAVNYPRTFALVDRTSGNDATGVAANETYYATNTSPAAFATIGRALIACYNTNSWSYTRTNYSGAVLTLSEANYIWLGQTVTLAGAPEVEALIQAATGATVTLTNVDDSRTLNDRDIFRLKNIRLNTAASLFIYHDQMWWDNVSVDAATGSRTWGINAINTYGLVATHCTLTNFAQGFRGASTEDSSAMLVRGNTIKGGVAEMVVYTVLGNLRTTNQLGTFTMTDEVSGMAAPRSADIIVAYNRFYALNDANIYNFNIYGPTNNGWAFVQNIWEYSADGNAADYFQIGALNTQNFTNVLWWHNETLGARVIHGYNSTGTAAAWRLGWNWMNCIDYYRALKTDTFGTPNANRIGNWPLVWGVGYSGNVSLNNTNSGWAFDPEFAGLHTYTGADSPPNYSQFVVDGSFNGVDVNPAPGGDYKIKSSSPLLINLKSRWVLPYDLEGNARGELDPPGAYSSAVMRKGAGFF